MNIQPNKDDEYHKILSKFVQLNVTNFVQQDVCRLQDWVEVKTKWCLFHPCRLLLELREMVHLIHRGDAVEDPAELSVLGYHTLQEDILCADAARQQ